MNIDLEGAIPLPNNKPFEATEAFYTCEGKGGIYRILGNARGAGESRETGEIIVYQDVADDSMTPFFRTVENFRERMVEIDLDEVRKHFEKAN